MSTVGLSAPELADAWPVLNLDERVEGFRLLPETETDEFFLGLCAADQAALLLGLSLPERRRWLQLLMKDAVADVVHEARRFGLLDLLDDPTRREVEAILHLGTTASRPPAEPEFGPPAPGTEEDTPERDKLPAGASYPEDEPEVSELDAAEAERLDAFAAGELESLEREQAEQRSSPEHERANDDVESVPPPEYVSTATTLRPPTPGRAPPFATLSRATAESAIAIYRSAGPELVREETLEPGVWVNVVNPSPAEISLLASSLDVELDFIKAALDEEERPRIEVENGATLIIIDVPALARDGSLDVYTTVPLGIVIARGCVVTVCLRSDTVLQDFISGRVKHFITSYRTRFVLQILHRAATRYLQYLRSIDKASHAIEQRLQSSMKNKELIQLMKLEKSLVYFETSLKSNELVLEKLMRVENVRSFPEDRELLEDVIIENKQALEMANIYSNILSGTMDAFASLISNNLNIVMKVLTSVTIVMAIPTMIASFFGMNVPLPFDLGSLSFVTIMGASAIACVVAVLILWRTRLL